MIQNLQCSDQHVQRRLCTSEHQDIFVQRHIHSVPLEHKQSPGTVRPGPERSGPARPGPARTELARPGPARPGPARPGTRVGSGPNRLAAACSPGVRPRVCGRGPGRCGPGADDVADSDPGCGFRVGWNLIQDDSDEMPQLELNQTVQDDPAAASPSHPGGARPGGCRRIRPGPGSDRLK